MDEAIRSEADVTDGAYPTPKTLTKAALADAVRTEVPMPLRAASDLVDQVLLEVADALCRGEDVRLSSFGSFLLRDKAARVGRNPRTGVEAPIPAHRSVAFRPTAKFRRLPRVPGPSGG